MNPSLPPLVTLVIAASALAAPITAFSFPPPPTRPYCDKRKDNPHCAGQLVTIGKRTSAEVQATPPDEVLNLRLTPPSDSSVQSGTTPVLPQPSQNAAPGR